MEVIDETKSSNCRGGEIVKKETKAFTIMRIVASTVRRNRVTKYQPPIENIANVL